MFKGKRNSIIKVIVILIIIVASNLIVNYPVVSAGRWRYSHTVEDIYNITLPTDDAIAIINYEFFLYGDSITLKSYTYDLIVGLRFDNISIPNNATHNYLVDNAYISLYSTMYPYGAGAGSLSIYYERLNYNVQTFTTYIELLQRIPSTNVRNWNLHDVHGLNYTTGQWNDSPNLAILVSEAIEYDNDTICFLLQSSYGGFRNFRSSEFLEGYAPRLHIISKVYEYEEDPPSGYDDATYIEQYEGMEIWYQNNSAWLNYSLYDQIGVDVYSGENDTYFYVQNMYEDTESYKRRSISERDIHNVKFGINITALPYSVSNGYVAIWAVTDSHTTLFDVDEGYIFCIYTFSNGMNFNAWSVEGGILKDSEYFGGTIYEHELPRALYFDLTFDEDTMTFTSNIYEDIDMLILNQTITNTFDLGAGDIATALEYVNGRTEPVGQNTGWSGAHISKVAISGYIIVDENDVTIKYLTDPPYDTIEDVKDWIDNYIGASSEYDKTPWMADFTLLLVGLVGVAFIPLGFLIFVSSVRDGDIIGGLQALVLMFFIGIGCIITWLWA